jgi:hypothetical protein
MLNVLGSRLLRRSFSSVDPICELCSRPIPPDVRQSVHHLIPRSRKGKNGPTVLLHQICHNQIHATLTERELARSYNTTELLQAHPPISKFIDFVISKPPGFYRRMKHVKSR